MPIDQKRFKDTGVAGCRWDSKTSEALFVVVAGSGSRRKRVTRVLTFASREAAKTAFAAFRDDVKRQDPGANDERIVVEAVAGPSRYELARYVETFWESLHARCGEATQRANKGCYDRHVKPFFGEKDIASITEADCEDFAASMKGFSPYTTNLALRFVRKVLHHARRRKVRLDVPDDFHFAREQMLKLELTESEQDRFFAAFDDRDAFERDLRGRWREGTVVRSAHFGFRPRRFGGSRRSDSDAAAVYFERFRRSRRIFIAAVDTGYRVTDLRLLKRAAVDLEKGVVAITTRKTGKNAVIGLSDRCRAAIEEAMTSAVTNAEYVFTTDEGQPYSEGTLRRYFGLAKKLAGITRRCRLNDLRHTFASNLASEGLSLLDIRDALGHTTVRMSERYAKPNEHSLERMREALNARQQKSGATRVPPDAQHSGQ
jgi:integrase